MVMAKSGCLTFAVALGLVATAENIHAGEVVLNLGDHSADRGFSLRVYSIDKERIVYEHEENGTIHMDMLTVVLPINPRGLLENARLRVDLPAGRYRVLLRGGPGRSYNKDFSVGYRETTQVHVVRRRGPGDPDYRGHQRGEGGEDGGEAGGDE